jgi:hypothetical protein
MQILSILIGLLMVGFVFVLLFLLLALLSVLGVGKWLIRIRNGFSLGFGWFMLGLEWFMLGLGWFILGLGWLGLGLGWFGLFGLFFGWKMGLLGILVDWCLLSVFVLLFPLMLLDLLSLRHSLHILLSGQML